MRIYNMKLEMNPSTWIVSSESNGSPSVHWNAYGIALRGIDQIKFKRICSRVIVPEALSHHVKAVTMNMHWMVISHEDVRCLENHLYCRIEFKNFQFCSGYRSPKTSRYVLARVIEYNGRTLRKICGKDTIDAEISSLQQGYLG